MFTISSEGRVTFSIPLLQFLLQNCYIWFKASFFADYVDYKDFNQVLNPEADVRFMNVMVTDTGDWDRYEAYYSQGAISSKDLAKNTRPYFPSTTPSIDLVKQFILPEAELSGDLEDNMAAIIEDAARPDSKIG
jgi:hypothetical protein